LTDDQQKALGQRYICEPHGSDVAAATEQAIETRICRLPNLAQDPDDYTTAGFYTPRITRRSDDRLEIVGHGFLAEVTLRPVLKGQLFAADGDLLALPLVIENYLRIIAAYASLMKGGLLVHSAGVIADGEAYLFLGPSGAGKTTMSRLALDSGAGVLSDDINIVLPSGSGAIRAGAVPFAGELGNSCLVQEGDYRLGGLFWLRKGGRSVDAEPMALSAQLARLYACCPVVNADARQADRILNAGAQLLTSQPLRALSFGPDETFPSILERIRNN
jgi:hypothetical protein